MSDDTTRANEAAKARAVADLKAQIENLERERETLKRANEAAKASAVANIEAQIKKNERVIEKLKRLQANPKDEQLLSDEEVIEAAAEGYRRQHPGEFSRNADGSFPLTPIEIEARKLRDARRALETSIVSGFALVDDIRSGAHEVRQGIAELNALLPRWTNLSPKVKDSIPNRVASLRAGRTLKKDLESQLLQIEQQWRERKRADALGSFERLRQEVATIEGLSIDDRRTLLKRAKQLRSKNRRFLEEPERDQLAEVIGDIRNRVDARWWEIWL